MTDPHRSSVPLRVLVVDDDAGIRALLEVTIGLDSRFALAGVASSATDARDLLESAAADGPLDVVLLDVTLPDGDGIELLPQIRALAPAARVVLFTGWSDVRTAARAQEAGADGVYEKTGDPIALLEDLCALTSVRSTSPATPS